MKWVRLKQALVLSAMAVAIGTGTINSCGRDDKKRANCVAYGDECHETIYKEGQKGKDGRDGKDGAPGADGRNCTVQPATNGSVISCPDGTTVVILNGTDGTDGMDGQDGSDGADAPPTAYSVVEVKDPCGKQASFDEVLLKMANGQWIAHFASGSNQFLTVLSPGSYRTTDGSSCYFTLNNAGQIINEHN